MKSLQYGQMVKNMATILSITPLKNQYLDNCLKRFPTHLRCCEMLYKSLDLQN